MAVSLPYLASNKNVGMLFERIKGAKVPDKFTHEFLRTTIGLKGTNDRQLISLLRNLGFIDQTGSPLPAYSLLKGHTPATAIARGVRHAYAPLFDADQEAHKLGLDRLKGLISQVGGVDADATARIASTFNSLVKLADFEAIPTESPRTEPLPADRQVQTEMGVQSVISAQAPSGLRAEFHYNIQIHLPSNGDEETYLNIFNAIRKTFQ